MSAQSPRDDEYPTLEKQDSPGKRLRIARQAKGLSQQDVATHLHLSVAIVQAMENDDHDRLPGPVFVRGYLRNYARMLGLDDNSVVDSSTNSSMDAYSAPPALASGVKPEIRSSHFGIRLMSWLIVIALIGLLAAWWQGRLEWPSTGTTQEVSAPAEPAVDEKGGLLLPEPGFEDQAPTQATEPQQDGLQEQKDTAPVPAAPIPTDRMAPEDTQSGLPAQTAAVEESVAVDEETVGQTLRGTLTAVGNTPATATAGGRLSTQTGAATGAQTGAEAADGVVFEFIGSCWVDIRDSTRNFKLFGEMRKGERHLLGGVPPYSVILGNSPMVQVTVGGQPYDVEAHSRGNVARFTLDPNVRSTD